MARPQRRVVAEDVCWHIAHRITASTLLRGIWGGAVDGERIVEVAFADRQIQINNLRWVHILGDDFSAEQVLLPIYLLVPPILEFMATGDYAHTAVFDH